MDELEDEAKCLLEDLSHKFHFQNVNAMLMYAESIKEMHLEDRCEECVEKFQQGASMLPAVQTGENIMAAADTSFTGVSPEKQMNRGRKSRKSVCIPKLAYSSSESENENEEDENENNENEIDESVFLDCHSREHSASEDFVDEENDRQKSVPEPELGNVEDDVEDDEKENAINVLGRIKALNVDENMITKAAFKQTGNADSDDSVVVTRKKTSRRIASESDEDDDNSDNDKNVHKISSSSEDDRGKKVKKDVGRRISISSDNNYESDSAAGDRHYKSRRVKMLSGESETNSDSDDDDESDESGKESSDQESNSDGESEELGKESDGGESGSDFDKSISNITRSIKRMNVVRDVSTSSADDSDFECKTKRSNLATPKPSKNRKPRFPFLEEETNVSVVKTPKSSIRKILSSLPTPSAVPGTPAYKRQFNGKREVIVKDLFKLYNETVFDNKLPTEFEITWNKRLTKTAGFCYLLRKGEERRSRIELSDKVIDSVERIRDTLIHEMCHAATWIFEGKRGHGYEWKRWANKANKIHPDLPVVTTCHSYEITTKYNFQCDGCGHVFGRHSKSIDPAKHRCGNCGGVPLLIGGGNSTSSEPKTPKLNAYATYVKENFSTVKSANPDLPTKDVMKKIAERYRINKKETGSSTSNKENVSHDM